MPESTAQPALSDIVIVGAGQAGFQMAASLRDEGFGGRIVLLGNEAGLPYQRPPLSKAYLTAHTSRSAIDLRPSSFFEKLSIELASASVTDIDRSARVLLTDDGTMLTYGHLVLALGARNRLLNVPGSDLDGVCYLRTASDAEVFRERLAGLRRIVIVGAGFIGLEIAALTCSLGIETTIIEAASRPMARAVSNPMSAFFQSVHEGQGARFLFNSTVASIQGGQGRVRAVETSCGRALESDLVLVGIGVVPVTELAGDCGLVTSNGIAVDERLLTSDPNISAIGDCASFPQFYAGSPMRLESVQNATDHARLVAARLTGKSHDYRAVPWFWSDQGKHKLQMAGLCVPHDTAVVRGDPSAGAFSVFCFQRERLVGVESVNKAADHVVSRRLIGAGATLTPREAADLSFDLKARASAVSLVA